MLTTISDNNIFINDSYEQNSEDIIRKYSNTFKNIQLKNLNNLIINPYSLNESNIQYLKLVKDKIKNVNVDIDVEFNEKIENYILHVGVGGFHRSHQAYYINKINKLSNNKWGIIGLGLCEWDKGMYNKLKDQDYMYTLLSRSPDNCKAEIINSIKKYVYIPESENEIKKIINNKIKILTLTITEKGYYFNSNYNLDIQDVNIEHDLKKWNKNYGIKQPKTIYGLLSTLILLRQQQGMDYLTVISCDNIPNNGLLTKRLLLEFVSHIDNNFYENIEKNIKFPNTMVDRITPYTKNSEKFFLQMNYNILDKIPVIAETYNYWVIENDYSNEHKPKWELCENIVETNNIEDYEKTKLLLLNSSHSFLAYLGYLLKDIKYIYEASNNKKILVYLNNYMEEVKYSLDLKNTNINTDDYIETTIKRFQNYYIKDEISRIAQDGSQKIKTTLHDCLHYFYNKDINNPPKFVSLLLALFINYMNSENNLISDPLKYELTNNNIHNIQLDKIKNHDIVSFFKLILDEKILMWKELIETIKIEYIKIKKGLFN